MLPSVSRFPAAPAFLFHAPFVFNCRFAGACVKQSRGLGMPATWIKVRLSGCLVPIAEPMMLRALVLNIAEFVLRDHHQRASLSGVQVPVRIGFLRGPVLPTGQP